MDIVEQIAYAENQLSEIDPEIGQLIAQHGSIVHYPHPNYFYSLCRSILGQQVSVASAAAVFGRLQTATDLDPAKVTALSDEAARQLGLSRQKAGYIRDLARHFVEKPGIYNHLESQTDEQVIEELTEIKGIGLWTAQMFLMFSLTRLDVFAADDIGVQRAMKQLYGWETLPARHELTQIADRWQPYRTIACWHLWESLNNLPA